MRLGNANFVAICLFAQSADSAKVVEIAEKTKISKLAGSADSVKIS